MPIKHNDDGWLDTANTPERQILDLRSIGMRHALTLGRFRYNQAADELQTRRHDAWMVLVFLLSGSQHYQIDGREVELRGGQGLRILPGQCYGTGGRPEQRGSLAWLILKVRPLPRGRALGMGTTGARAVFSLLMDASRPVVFDQVPAVPGMIDSVFKAWRHHEDPLSCEIIRNQVAALVLASASAIGTPRCDGSPDPANAARIDKVLHWVSVHLSDLVTVEMMAEVSGLSPARFYGEFKKRTGTSPKDYLLGLRIECAAQRLRDDPGMTVTDVAHELGFSSSQYFATVFRRYVGISPRDWRREQITPRDQG